MGVFLGLSDSRLGHMMRCQVLPEGVGHFHLLEGHALVGDGHIILGEANVFYVDPFFPRETVKLVRTEGAGDLSCTVRAEIVENDGVVVLYGCHRLAVFHDDGGYNELIGHFFVIGCGYGAQRAHCGLAHTDLFHLIQQLLDIILAGCRRGISAIQEAVYIYFLQAVILRHLQQGIQMGVVAVYAAVR